MGHLYDGLKPSYRRVIWTGLEHPDKLVKVATLAGVCGGKYSPHSPDSLPAVISELVRSGYFIGQGSHGSPSIYKPLTIDPAAPRYIEAKLHPEFRKMIQPLIPFVPYKESEVDSMYKEPLYIPIPIPIAMCFNSLGIGVGIRMKTPNFSMKSMLDAYFKDDPTLLRSNTDLEIDSNTSELNSIWNKGYGRVTYKFFVDNKFKLEGQEGVLLYGNSSYIQLSKLSSKLKSPKEDPEDDEKGWMDKGLVEMIDLSSKRAGNKIFFRLKKGQRGKDKVTLKMLSDEITSIGVHSDNYNLAITDGDQTKVRPLKEWIKFSYTNFESLVKKYKTDKLSKLKLKSEVLKYSYDIAKAILADPKASKGSLSKTLGIKEEVVSEALKRSISSLLKGNVDSDIKSVKAEIKYVKSLKTKNFYEDFIK